MVSAFLRWTLRFSLYAYHPVARVTIQPFCSIHTSGAQKYVHTHKKDNRLAPRTAQDGCVRFSSPIAAARASERLVSAATQRNNALSITTQPPGINPTVELRPRNELPRRVMNISPRQTFSQTFRNLLVSTTETYPYCRTPNLYTPWKCHSYRASEFTPWNRISRIGDSQDP